MRFRHRETESRDVKVREVFLPNLLFDYLIVIHGILFTALFHMSYLKARGRCLVLTSYRDDVPKGTFSF